MAKICVSVRPHQSLTYFLSGPYLSEDVPWWNQHLLLPPIHSFLPSQMVLIRWHPCCCAPETWGSPWLFASRTPQLPSPPAAAWRRVHHPSAILGSWTGLPGPWFYHLFLPGWNYDLHWRDTGALATHQSTPLALPVFSAAWKAPFPQWRWAGRECRQGSAVFTDW